MKAMGTSIALPLLMCVLFLTYGAKCSFLDQKVSFETESIVTDAAGLTNALCDGTNMLLSSNYQIFSLNAQLLASGAWSGEMSTRTLTQSTDRFAAGDISAGVVVLGDGMYSDGLYRRGQVLVTDLSVSTDNSVRKASDTLESRYGESVAVSGRTIVVGAPGTSHNGDPNVGQVAIYTLLGTSPPTMDPQATLDDPMVTEFGRNVVLRGGVLLISAMRGGDGVVFAYRSTNGIWARTKTYSPADGKQDPEFGTALATNGDMAVIGSPGVKSIIVFTNGDTSTITKDIEGFGSSVAIGLGSSDEVITVGAPNPAGPGGTAIYHSHDGAWTELKYIPDPTPSRVGLGSSVTMCDDMMIASASTSGSAQVYRGFGCTGLVPSQPWTAGCVAGPAVYVLAAVLMVALFLGCVTVLLSCVLGLVIISILACVIGSSLNNFWVWGATKTVYYTCDRIYWGVIDSIKEMLS